MNELWIIIDFALTIARWVIIIQAILSWLISFNVINTSNDLIRGLWRGLEQVTEPIYRPIRRILPDFGALDLSPIVVLALIWLLQGRLIPALMMRVAGYGG